MKMNRVMAIAEKDFKEYMRNMMLLTMPVLPILLGLMYSKMPMDELPNGKEFIAIIIVGMALGAVITQSMMTMLAEENEKHTLRGLINSPASMFDILAGKSIVVIAMFILSIIVSFVILKVNVLTNVSMIIGFILLILFFLFLGIGIGLFVKSVSETSLYLIPILFLFSIGPMFNMIGFSKDNVFMKIMEYMPLNQYLELSESGDMKHIFIILAWVAISFIVMTLLFNRARTDK